MGDNGSRRLWALCTLFGAGVIAFIVWFSGVIPDRTCTGGGLPPGVSSLLMYQLARTPAEIEAVFGAAGDPCRATMIAAMDRANTVDLVGFIATYGAFLAFFFAALAQTGAGIVARCGLVAVATAVGFDVLETSTQLHITTALPGSTAALTALTIGSRGKYLALAVVCLCAGIAMFARGKIAGRIAGAACIAGGVMVLAGLVASSALPALSAGNALAWVVMLVYVATAVVRRN